MMIVKNATSGSKAAQAPRTEYSWVAVAALIVTLVLGLFVVPQAAALGSTDLGESEPSHFSSQAEAIDYYLAKLQREREEVEPVSFSSQAEAIDYYLAKLQCEREEVEPVSFSSQAEAIDYYLAKLQRDREGVAGLASSAACLLVE